MFDHQWSRGTFAPSGSPATRSSLTRFCVPKLRGLGPPRKPIEDDAAVAGGPWRQGPPFGAAARVRPVPPLPPAENLATDRAEPARSVALEGILAFSERLAHGCTPGSRPPWGQADPPVGRLTRRAGTRSQSPPAWAARPADPSTPGSRGPPGRAGGFRRARGPCRGVRPVSCSAGRLRDPSRHWPPRGERRGPTHRDWTAGPHSGRTGDNLKKERQ